MGMRSLGFVLLHFVLVSSFVVPRKHEVPRWTTRRQAAAKATLDNDTTWKMKFLLQAPTEKGKKVDQIFIIDVQFVEDVGYEPPQGSVSQVSGFIESQDSGEEGSGEMSRLKVIKSRWQLSEDPDDRKDGLWVWGLFKEPLYPFMLLQLELDSIPLPGSEGDSIKPLKLFAQINHARDDEKGVILSGGDLKVREIETVKADPFGAATVDIYEEISVGKLSIQQVSS